MYFIRQHKLTTLRLGEERIIPVLRTTLYSHLEE
uniref:Uncharacterized protein n=1 Tax=Myoviridae sp. ctijX18 TaxID=2825154 RepID=A0A8S5USW9_9CAUD|nr:MAG TPA: hypothetical protein [Myoviridae sp. ctijX18]DAJ69046.1 MAG TPA: hypothetical protein [Caudoviricetes sp.]